jgi:hypothetical protein
MAQHLSVHVVTLSLVTLLERLLLMSNAYYTTRSIVRGVFWACVAGLSLAGIQLFIVAVWSLQF